MKKVYWHAGGPLFAGDEDYHPEGWYMALGADDPVGYEQVKVEVDGYEIDPHTGLISDEEFFS